MPKVGKMAKGDAIQKRLKKKSPWFASISDPLHGADCKIPDETGVETGTTQLVQKFTVTTNSTGNAGFKIITPYVNSCLASSQIAAGDNWQTLDPSATDTSIAWGSTNYTGGVWTIDIAAPFAGIDELQSITDAHRIVSACLMVQPEPSLSSNQGEYSLFAYPFSLGISADYVDYMNSYKAVTIPVSDPQAGIVRWYPFYREDFSFKSFFRTTGTALNTQEDDSNIVPYWQLGMLTSGCAENVSFRITVVVNYEFKPIFNTLNVVDASPSPQDTTETDLVENWVQDLPIAQPIPQKTASSSPDSVSPKHGENDSGTGFGMFFNVISELAPLALALL